MGKLVHRFEGKVVAEYGLKPGALTIGRAADNDVRLDDVTVSGHHARLSIEPSGYLYARDNEVYIEDCGSTNGTMLGGKRIERELLQHGDIVRIGQHEFSYIDEHKLRMEQTRVIPPQAQR